MQPLGLLDNKRNEKNDGVTCARAQKVGDMNEDVRQE